MPIIAQGEELRGTDAQHVVDCHRPEQEGFEPPVPCDTTVFKTVALSHSATAPHVHSPAPSRSRSRSCMRPSVILRPTDRISRILHED